ncbi:MAG: hypothetical protein GX117_11410 [Candidatus Hydrogenedentes bacterium]|jgi:hypothetical protein|nr:hypothetical protein [Candidatus Hydrogenedentota bacterium]
MEALSDAGSIPAASTMFCFAFYVSCEMFVEEVFCHGLGFDHVEFHGKKDDEV